MVRLFEQSYDRTRVAGRRPELRPVDGALNRFSNLGGGLIIEIVEYRMFPEGRRQRLEHPGKTQLPANFTVDRRMSGMARPRRAQPGLAPPLCGRSAVRCGDGGVIVQLNRISDLRPTVSRMIE